MFIWRDHGSHYFPNHARKLKTMSFLFFVFIFIIKLIQLIQKLNSINKLSFFILLMIFLPEQAERRLNAFTWGSGHESMMKCVSGVLV